MLTLRASEPELADRTGAVFQQPGSVLGIDPGFGDYSRAVHRSHVVLVRLDDGVDDVGRDQAALDQQCLDGFDALLGVALGLRVMTV